MPDTAPRPAIVPVPDPSTLTTAQLKTAIDGAHELFAAKLEIIHARLHGMDEGQQRLREFMARAPSEAERLVSHQRQLMDEKFASVETQFTERDVRTEQDKTSTKVAVDAALSAQKEAAGAQNDSNTKAIEKSEASTAKQLDGINQLLRSNVEALNDKIADLKGRLDRGEGSHIGGKEAVASTRSDHTLTVSIIMAGIGIVSLIMVGGGLLIKSTPAASPIVTYAPGPAR